MKVDKIELTNFRRFIDLTVDFDEHLTVIAGKNGTGKSSILNAVAISLSWFIARIKSEKGSGLYIEEDSITNGQHHSQIKATIDGRNPIVVPNKAKKGINKRYQLDLESLRRVVADYRSNFELTDFKVSVPVVVLYGVRRAVIDVPLRIRNKEYGLLDTYKDCLEGSANFRDFFTWYRNQEDIENDYLLNGTPEGVAGSPTRELDTIRRALSAFMPGFSRLKVNRHPLKMVVEKGNERLDVAQLSDGEKIYFALIGDLCHRLVLANPALDDPLEGEGVVMIDELDLHLHPEWQIRVVSQLTKVFKNIQFIITTHSPHVINHVPTQSLRIIDDEERMTVDASYGLPSEIVLRDIMGLENDVPKEIDDAFRTLYLNLSQNDTVSAERLLSDIEAKVPQHPELVRARKLIERIRQKQEL